MNHGVLPFILIVGAFRPDQVNEILDGFLNRVKKRIRRKKKSYRITWKGIISNLIFFERIGKCRTSFECGLP